MSIGTKNQLEEITYCNSSTLCHGFDDENEIVKVLVWSILLYGFKKWTLRMREYRIKIVWRGYEENKENKTE